ncbi:MAG TPA: hypothetical protein VJ001_15070, partial [Rhodocyclaceae bacterium]|nr:hypothetical protein [Rhodocyclaceae bacterium]
GVKVQQSTLGRGSSVSVDADDSVAGAANESGIIGSDVEIDGVAVINGEVFIDGEKVQRGKTSYTSKKSGKSYRIQWGKNGNVSVEQK